MCGISWKGFDMTDEQKALVKRLRSVDISWSQTGEWCAEAADLIEAQAEQLVAWVQLYDAMMDVRFKIRAERDAQAAEIARLREALSACVWDLTELYGEVLADSKQQGIDRVERDVVLIAARAALAQETQP
jgi:hypothetical protein